MSPYADKSLDWKGLKWSQGLKDTPHPAGHLSGRVDIVWLGVLGETFLKADTFINVSNSQ